MGSPLRGDTSWSRGQRPISLQDNSASSPRTSPVRTRTLTLALTHCCGWSSGPLMLDSVLQYNVVKLLQRRQASYYHYNIIVLLSCVAFYCRYFNIPPHVPSGAESLRRCQFRRFSWSTLGTSDFCLMGEPPKCMLDDQMQSVCF